MNLNEKCLLRYLINPVNDFNKNVDMLANVRKAKDFVFTDLKDDCSKVFVNK